MTKDEKILTIINQLALFRGMVINQAVVIERAMDEFLSIHFCGSDEAKRKELFELVLSEYTTFDIKKKCLENVITKNYPDFLKNNISFFSDINCVMINRNIVAHWLYDTTDEGVVSFDKKERAFIRFKVKTNNSSSNRKVYTQENIDNIFKKADNVIILLSNLTEITRASLLMG